MQPNWALSVPTGLGHGELEELVGDAVVEPVHDLLRDDRVRYRIVREHFDRHALVDDLADLLLCAVGERDPRAIRQASEHHADLFPQLVDEDADGAGAVEVAGELAQRLAHQPGLETHVRVAHLAFDLGAGHERGHRVDDDHVERAGADEHVGDLERLLAGVGLGDVEVVDVHTDGRGVDRVHRVLGVDVGADAAVALRLGDHVHRERGLPRRLGAEHLDDTTAGKAADAECDVERERAGGDGGHADVALLPQPHDGALAVVLLDLAERHLECLVSFHGGTLLNGMDAIWDSMRRVGGEAVEEEGTTGV